MSGGGRFGRRRLLQRASWLAAGALPPRRAAAGKPDPTMESTVAANQSANTEAWPGDAFPVVEPAEVGCDADKLARAVAFIDEQHAAGVFPGAGVVAMREGRVFLQHACGMALSVEGRQHPFALDHYNLVYSFSKVVTATVAVMAHEDGLIDYDAPVAQAIPEFGGEGRETITLRHLMTHSAGIPACPLPPVHTEARWREALEAICAAPMEWPAGSRTYYHALTGMFLVAEVIRRAHDGEPWESICTRRLCEPLGADLSFAWPNARRPLNITPQPEPHELEDKLREPHLAGHPAGGALARPVDMLKLLQLHLDGGTWKGRRLIAEAELAEMHRVQYADRIDAALAAGDAPAHEYWALGWMTRGRTNESWFGFGDSTSPRTFGHAGIDTTIGLADPESGLALVLQTTDSIRDEAGTMHLRNTVTNLLARSLS